MIAVEHSLEFLASCDWLVDLGPEAGDAGGEIVAEGTPEELSTRDTATGRSLREFLGGERP